MNPVAVADAFSEFLEQLPMGVVELSPIGEPTFINESARLLMRGPPGAAVREALGRLARGAWAAQTCIEHSLALGALGEVRLWAAPKQSRDGIIVALERHAGSRSRLESKLMSMLVKSATGAETWQASATRALETLCAALPGTHLVLYEVESEGLSPTAHAALPPAVAGALKIISRHPSELVGRVFATAKMMAVSPIATSPLLLPFAYPQAAPALAAIAVPLMGSGGVRGVLYACGPESVLSEAEARLLLQLAEMLGLLLEQKGRDERLATELALQQRLRAEAQAAMNAAARNERLAILGRLTAGVGHELNNPLSYLTTNIGALREELELVESSIPAESLEEMRSMLDDCEEGVKRLVSIVHALKGSSRQENVSVNGSAHGNTTVFDPAHAVSNAVTLFRGVHRHRVAVEWESRSLPLVQGSVSALSQVVLNLLQNGFDAMGGKGRLTLSGAAHADEGAVVIEVADEGPGIPAEVQPHVFEPFYTTKPEGTGTGLGLYLCKQMVAGMGGTVEFRSGSSGTVFRVKLPVAAEELDEALA